MLRRRLAPLCVIAVALVQFRASLVGRVWRFEDIAGYFEPLWAAAARAMREGRWPVWATGAWSGQPLAGDPQLGAFYPPNWLWLLLPVLRAYALLVAAHAAWGGLGMYALARARGRSRAASAMAGIALGAGGFVVLQTRHIMFVEATAWLPWVALVALRAVAATGRARLVALAGVALSVGLLFLTGGESMIYYGLWFAFALVLARALAVDKPLVALAALAGAFAVGLCLAAPSLVPMFAHGPLSPRAQGTEYDFVASVAWRGLWYLPSLFIPNLLGQDVRGNYIGGGTQWEIAGYYAGMLPFALALFALARPPVARRRERWFLVGILTFAVLLAPGAHSVVHRLAYRVLPLYSSMRCPPRALYVFVFVVPLAAADGLDRLRALLRCKKMRVAWLPALAVALVAVDLLVTHRAENPSLTLAEAHAAATPEALGFLEEHRGDRFVNDVMARHDLHNAGLLWGLENASGYSSLPIWRYLHYEWIANHGAPYPHPRLHDDLSAQGLWRFSSPLVDALNVRWVLTKRPPNAPHYVRRFVGGDGLDVWENLHALPRAYVVHRARVVESEAAAARAIAAPGFDPSREAVLEGAPDPSPQDGPAASPVAAAGYGPVTALEYRDAETLAYEVDLDRPGVLVMAEPFYPGWSATLDGKPTPLLAADLALRAVALPAGHHRVDVTFRSHPVEQALALALAAALAVLTLLVFSRRSKGDKPARGQGGDEAAEGAYTGT